MTVEEIAKSFIDARLGNLTMLHEQDIIDIKTQEEYENIRFKQISHKEQLDNITTDVTEQDFLKIDSLYCSKYAQLAADKRENVIDRMSTVIAEANSRLEELNKPIETRWNSIKAEYENLQNIKSKIMPYSKVLRFYYNVTKSKIESLESLDINQVNAKLDKVNDMISLMQCVNKVMDLDDFILSIIAIVFMLLLATPISGFLIITLAVVSIAAIIVLFIMLKDNNDVVSFALQPLEELNEQRDHKLLTFDDDGGKLDDLQVKMNALEEELNSKEQKELDDRGNGIGKEEAREEFIKQCNELTEIVKQQYDLNVKLEAKLILYENSYNTEHKFLGQRFSTDNKLDWNITIGKKDLFEETMNIKDKVILLQYKDVIERDRVLKYLLVSIFSNVKLTNIMCYIYDPKYLGSFTYDIGKYEKMFKLLDNNLNEVLEKAKEIIKETQSKRKATDIDTYNSSANTGANLPTQYSIFIMDLKPGEDDSAEINNEDLMNRIPTMLENGIIPIIASENVSTFKTEKEVIKIC